MAFNLKHPVDIFRDLAGNLVQRHRKLAKLLLPFRPDIRLSLIEQNFRLENESVADNADIIAPAQHVTKPSKEF